MREDERGQEQWGLTQILVDKWGERGNMFGASFAVGGLVLLVGAPGLSLLSMLARFKCRA